MRANERAHTVIDSAETNGLGSFQFLHPPGTFALTPASRIALRAVSTHQHLLAGRGIDWGSGTGCLTIAAARAADVESVLGLELSAENVAIAWQNAALNAVGHKTQFALSDSYAPLTPEGQAQLAPYKGQTNFVVSNPPSSEGDDGFAFRRVVLRDARPFLVNGGVVLLNISYQYGQARIDDLHQSIDGYRYEGVIATTDWVPFELERRDLYRCIENYCVEEARGGMSYAFAHPADPSGIRDARAALADYTQTGNSPLSKWQTHLFRYVGVRPRSLLLFKR